MKCKAITAKGTPCSNNAKDGVFCKQHTPKVDPRNHKTPDYSILSDEIKVRFLYILDTENDITKAFEAMDSFRTFFDFSNDKYKFYVTKDVILNFEKEIKKFMKNDKRIRLLIDYIFIHDERDISVSFTEYDFKEVGTIKDDFDLYIKIYSFCFRGYEKSPHPIRAVLRPEEKLNSVIPSVDFSKLPPDIFVTLNESINFAEVIKRVVEIKEYIDKLNPKYDFNVQLNVIDYMNDQLKSFIDNKRRIRLVIDYIFIYKDRTLNYPVSYYCCNTNMVKADLKYIESIFPRGCSQAPIRVTSEGAKPSGSVFSETKPSGSESKPSGSAPKTSESNAKESKPSGSETKSSGSDSKPSGSAPEGAKESKSSGSDSKESKEQRFKRKYLEIANILKKYMENSDIKDFFRIIYTSTDNLKHLTREDILKFYKKFHPDKSKGDEIQLNLFNLISSKLSVLKEQSGDKTVKIKPVGNLYKELCGIIKVTP